MAVRTVDLETPMHFSSMADFHYQDDEFRFFDLIYNSVVANSQTPYPFETFKGFAVVP